MNSKQSPISPESRQQARLALWISLLLALVLAAAGIYAIYTGASNQVWSIAPVFLASLMAIWFINSERYILGSSLLIAAIGLQTLISPFVESGSRVSGALSSLALIGCIGLLTLPRKYIGRVLIAGTSVAILSILIDLYGSANRPIAGSAEIRWLVAYVLLAIFILLFARQFFTLDIRTKIVMGIIITSGVALGVLIAFSLDQTDRITTNLSNRLEESVKDLAEEQLINTVNTAANDANQSFDNVRKEVSLLAHNWESLQNEKQNLSIGTYWEGRNELRQFDEGQYGNSSSDPSSVYVPATVELTDTFYADVNTSAYLDFYAPEALRANPSLLAVYAIDTRGVTRYYPNIDLASLLPVGFDPTQRPYYEITAPLFNPKRLTKWTIPYIDATGGGLVVTVASPVYVDDQFKGIFAADMQLKNVTSLIDKLKIGQTGFAFMIDDAGHILSLPLDRYKLFGLDPNIVNGEEFFKYTVLAQGSLELQSLTKRMTSGGSGLLNFNNDGVDTYASYAPILVNGYSLAIVVPAAELQDAIITARNETETQRQSGLKTAVIILTILLFIAILISMGIGQIISAPIIQLTGVANEILTGDLTAQAKVESADEIGTLSHAFNTMTSRLRGSLAELEGRVSERTTELLKANERNERRAKQFEAISQVAATISSTQNLDILLPQITTVISTRFGFYHVGIFLLDSRKEYAVLSAANSEGGQKMLERNHRLKVGETGLVGFVTSTGKPRLALNTGQDTVFFNNPDLPETHSEITLPLRSGNEVIGALDVQSEQVNAFDQEDINILAALADQVSIAIQNARQYEETRKALAESEALSRQFVQTGWQQFKQSQKLTGIRHTGVKATLLYAKKGPGKDDAQLAQSEARTKNRGAFLSLPVKLRGEVIGSVDIRSQDNRQWDQDELDVVTAIIERAAIAMENARLLTESQKRAAKERTIGEISAKISAQSDIDQLIRTAAQELNRTIPGAEIAIQFTENQETE